MPPVNIGGGAGGGGGIGLSGGPRKLSFANIDAGDVDSLLVCHS
jgi:hypothetical protein